MEPDRWQRLTELFNQALDLEPGRRDALLDEACRGDPSMRAELESLLGYHAQASQLLDRPLILEGAHADDSLVGRSFDQYRVTRRLGAGGMGVVYLADDTRLGRPVALKVLTRTFTQDAQRRERLRREARAAAALSHPAIATVYALEEVDEMLFIVSEYVDGATLREEVARRPLSTRVLLETGIEIAEALAAAHRRGIVHRDLKPDNVIRTADGGIKVLDFGLAQVVETLETGLDSPGRLTEAGAVLGTPGYMSPEQLRGAEADVRADIFSFGVTLFELASGVHPFSSETGISTIAKVLEADPPDLGQLRPGCPPRLIWVIARCLEKDPGRRFSSTLELVDALEDLRRDVAAGHPLASAPSAPVADHHPARVAPASPLWWWQFHQVGISLGYGAMLIPLWSVRLWAPAPWGPWVFFAALVAVGAAATLRLHLWFTSRYYPAELTTQRHRSRRWIALGDCLFVGTLLLAGVWSVSEHAQFAALFVAVAVASLVGFTVVEPATTRAALGSSSQGARSDTDGRPRG